MDQPLDIYKQIISSGKILPTDYFDTSQNWGSHLFLAFVSIIALYYVNIKWDDNILLGNIAIIIMLACSIYIPIQINRKLKVTFYENNSPFDSKERLINKMKELNHWKLLTSERNYYLFFEDNLILQSYYITIVFDHKGFYINCYPTKGRVLDFGRSKRWSNQLYEEMKACL